MKLRVSEIAKEKGLTLQNLADKIGVSRQSLANTLSKGNPTVETLEKISSALDVPVWQLIVSPVEVKGSDVAITCPHCHMPITLKVE